MTRWEMVEHLRQDIRQFKTERGVDRVVVLWAASTEIYVPVDKVHESVASLEAAMRADDREHVAPSMCYAYAALMEARRFRHGCAQHHRGHPSHVATGRTTTRAHRR